MNIGRFTIEQLNEGQFDFFEDGTINRSPVKRSIDFSVHHHKETAVGINPLYITDGYHHILLDAGLGWGLDAGSKNKDVSNIVTNLEIFDVAPSDITHVILTHLHYDHAAGASYTDAHMRTRPTFPHATYILQQSEWEFAVQQVQHQTIHSTFYRLDDLYRLYADNLFSFVDVVRAEIIPGIEIIKTAGHTPGHQVVKIDVDSDQAYYLGDVLPTPDQLNYFDVANKDMDRIGTKRAKIKLLRKAYEQHAYLFFYHSLHAKTGRLAVDQDKKYVLEEP